MPTPATMTPSPERAKEAIKPDLWKQALTTLSAEDQKQYEDCSSSMLDVLKQVQEATESKKQDCLSKGWNVYRNKQGEEVKLRHVLEKLSVWVKGIINMVDVGISFDQSGHAALPWAIVKYLTTIGISDINVFSSLVEGIESSAKLVARYVIVEKLYLHYEYDAALGLQEAIGNLYATVLTYLARVKIYFTGGTLKRLGRAFLETMRNEYTELLKKVSETEVEQWTRLVEEEREHVGLSIAGALTYGMKVHQRARKDVTEHDQMLRQTLAEFKIPIVQMSDQISVIQDTFNREERKRAFRWMSEIEYRSHHEDLSKNLLPQSGRWLLDCQDFIEWGQSSVSSVLWLHGIPGSGKTKLASTVINLMLDADSASTAFFYCARSTQEPARGRPAEILCALLRQLCTSNPDQPVKNPVAREYEARKKIAEQDCSTIKRLTVEDCTRLIIELTKDHPATIILDALDECEEMTRHELLEALEIIINNSANVVKIFLSSRDDIDIKLHLEGSRNISISVEKNSADIARFVKSEIHRLISKRLLLDGKVSKNLKERILHTLIIGAQGMFRWVEMSLEALSQIKYTPDFKKALGQLPTKLSDLYDIIYTQIDQTRTCGRNMAIMTLTWLLCAQRLLRAEELLAAVHAVDAESSSESDEDDDSGEAGSPENDVLRVCRNLVVFDSEQSTFRFAHQSVREYLLGKSEYTVMRQHALATERCLDVYLTEPSPGFRVSRSVQQNSILKDYAGAYWPVHYQYIGECEFHETHEKVSRFLMEGSRTSHFYIQWASSIRSKDENSSWPPRLNQALGLDPSKDHLSYQLCLAASTPETYLSVACAFGFSKFLKNNTLSFMELNQRQKVGQREYTFLLIAVQEGHDQLVELLLDQGADVNVRGGRRGNALREASSGGHAQNECPNTALQIASHRGYDKVVQVLLDKGADVNVQCDYFGNALQAASYMGFDKVVQMLLDKGADVNAQCEYGEKFVAVRSGNALQAASYGGYNKIIQLLLDQGADINAQGGHFGSALQAASSQGYDEVVQMLLDRGAEINVQGGEYGNALQAAAFKGHSKVVQLLLNHDAFVNQKDIQGRTALHLACAGGQMEFVETLLSFGFDPTIIDTQGRSSLHHAVSKGSIEIVNWLLKKGFDPNYADRDGWTSLHWAARNRYRSVGIMKVLKAAGASSTIEAIEGWTPDSVAIFHHNSPSSRSCENAKSESSSATAAESINDEAKMSPVTWQNRYYCDGCLLDIYGARYKCLDCPNFDYCFKCKNSSDQTHVGHRFEKLLDEEPV